MPAGLRRSLSVVFALSSTIPAANATGYYECRGADGTTAFSVERCKKSEDSTFIADAAPARSVSLGGNQPLTSQVIASGKHFRGIGYINGLAVPMMMDTGATFVVLPSATARRAGVNLSGARPVTTTTANGNVHGLHVTLDEVTFAGQRMRNVPATIQTTGIPFPGVLLGMSYLENFELNVNRGVLSLTRK